MSIATEIQRLQTAKADIRTAIEEKGVEVGDGLIDTYAEKIGEIEVGGDYEQGFADGKNSLYPNNIPIYDFRTFDGESIEIENANVKAYTVALVINNANDGFCKGNANLKSVIAMFPNATFGRHAFNGCSNLEYVKIDTSSFSDNGAITAFNNMFSNCPKLKRIDGIVDGSKCDLVMDNPFNNSSAIEYIAFAPLSIVKSIYLAQQGALTDEGIQAVINGLADLTGAETRTLTFHKTVGDKLTDTQKATITAKNWTLAY